MEAAQVVDVLDQLAAVTRTAWLGGGWAVDALVGRQTRPHADVDLIVDAADLDAVLDRLHGLGYADAEDWLPVRIEVAHPDGRRIDLHPVVFAADGSGVQAGLDGATFDYPAGCATTGRIAGREVACLTATRQLAFRQGYEPRPVDTHDIAHLRALGTVGGGS